MHPGIAKVDNKLQRGISALLYADPGVGKTTCLARLPPDETLIINAESGLGPLLGTGHYVFELSRDLQSLAGIYKYLRSENHPFKYVVIDNISELQEWMVLSLTESRKKDFAEIREKGDAAGKMREYLYKFRNLIELDICVIFSAWEMSLTLERGQEGPERSKIFPKLYPSISPEVCGIVDLVGHLEKYEKTEDRYIRFVGNEKVMAKSQYRGVDKFEPADFMAVFKKIRAFNYETAKPIEALVQDEINLCQMMK